MPGNCFRNGRHSRDLDWVIERRELDLCFDAQGDDPARGDRGVAFQSAFGLTLAATVHTDLPQLWCWQWRDHNVIEVLSGGVDIAGLLSQPEVMPALSGCPAGRTRLNADRDRAGIGFF